MFLSKRSNGFWYIFYENRYGKRTCLSTKSKLKSDALKFLSNLQDELRSRKSERMIPISLSDFRFHFLKYSESIHSEKTTKVFKTTFKFLINYFGNLQLQDLTINKINDFLQYRLNTSSIYAARKDLINLSSALSKAVIENYLLENPCKKIKRIKIPEKQPLFFTEPDYQVLLKSIDVPIFRDLIGFAVNTGLRQMEILTLEWNQVNFIHNYIILDNRNHTTKSKKIRTIPLNLSALQILVRRKQSRISELIFTVNGTMLKQQFISRTFKKYVLKSGLNSKLNFHSLRHTFASWLVQRGVSIYEVSKLLGHSDVRVTEIYSHLRTEDLMRSVNLLNN